LFISRASQPVSGLPAMPVATVILFSARVMNWMS
jgi:hypothetical protein